MKTKGSPFAHIDGRPYVIANFTLEPAFGFPSLADLLEELLGKYPGEDILVLRRLDTEEEELLTDYTENFEHEAWSVITAKAEKR